MTSPSQEIAERQVIFRKAWNQDVDQWKRFESYLNCIAQERRETARSFIEYLTAKQLSLSRIETYILALRNLEIIGKPYTAITKQDLMRWSNRLATTVSPGTSNLYRICIRRFFQWLLVDDEDSETLPDVVKWIKIREKRKDYGGIVLSKDQVLQMIQLAECQRDRAILFVLYESGARASELLSLRIKDITLDQYGAVIRVNGKTWERRIRLIESVPDLRLWISMHPHSQEPDSKLWTCLRHPHQPITWIGLYQIIQRYAKRIGLDGEISPHSFRHARATHLAGSLTEAQMKEIFGWTKGSDMPARYVHLSGRDVDNAILKLHGIKVEEQIKAQEVLKPKECPRCKVVNSPVAKFCQQCSLPLDIRTAIELERAATEADAISAQVLEYITKKMPSLVAEAIIATNSVKAISTQSFDAQLCAKGVGNLL